MKTKKVIEKLEKIINTASVMYDAHGSTTEGYYDSTVSEKKGKKKGKLDEQKSKTFKEKTKKTLECALKCTIIVPLVGLLYANNGIQSLRKSYYKSRKISYDENYCGPIKWVSKKKYQ